MSNTTQTEPLESVRIESPTAFIVGAIVEFVPPLIEVIVTRFLAPDPISTSPVNVSPIAKPFLILIIDKSRTVADVCGPSKLAIPLACNLCNLAPSPAGYTAVV